MKKTVKWMSSVLFFAMAVFFISCDTVPNRVDKIVQEHDPSPKDYQTSIDDFVKYQVAVCDALIQKHSDLVGDISSDNAFLAVLGLADAQIEWEEYVERIDGFNDYMLELQTYGDVCYKDVLQKVSNTPNHEFQDIAQKVYAEYIRTSITLSEYQQLSTNYWQFQELNTGIVFQLTIDIDDDKYSCQAEDGSLTHYLEKHIK